MTQRRTQRRIGLTGGIATGKTTVSRYLEQTHHLPVLDADLYARQAVAPGSPPLQEIVNRYGEGILLPGGNLDRPQLGHIIFQDASEREWLESLIHPWVEHCFQQALTQDLDNLDKSLDPQALTQLPSQAPIVVLAIPLLFETGYHCSPWVTETWVVYCTPQQQLDRLRERSLRERNRLSIPEAQARIEAQLPLVEKCGLADVVLDNTGSIENLQTQIDRALGHIPTSPQKSP